MRGHVARGGALRRVYPGFEGREGRPKGRGSGIGETRKRAPGLGRRLSGNWSSAKAGRGGNWGEGDGGGGDVRRELRGAVPAEGTEQPTGGERGVEAKRLRRAREGRCGSEELRGGVWVVGVVLKWRSETMRGRRAGQEQDAGRGEGNPSVVWSGAQLGIGKVGNWSGGLEVGS